MPLLINISCVSHNLLRSQWSEDNDRLVEPLEQRCDVSESQGLRRIGSGGDKSNVFGILVGVASGLQDKWCLTTCGCVILFNKFPSAEDLWHKWLQLITCRVFFDLCICCGDNNGKTLLRTCGSNDNDKKDEDCVDGWIIEVMNRPVV